MTMKRMLSAVIVAGILVNNSSASAVQRQSADYWLKYAGQLPIGSTVRVRTTDGRRTTAVLAIVDETGITIQPKTRPPEPPRHIAFDQLAQVELKERGGVGAGQAAFIGVVAGAGTFLGILLLVLATGLD